MEVARGRDAILKMGAVVDETPASDEFLLHVVTWHAIDEQQVEGEEDEDEGEGEAEKRCPAGRQYVIRAFGVAPGGRSACLRIDGFTPYFYVKLPRHGALLSGPRRRTALAAIERHLSQLFPACRSVVQVRKQDFWGFTDGETFDFVRLAFSSLVDMRRAASKLRAQPGQRVREIGVVQLKLYESNIDPLLRFIHISGVKPVGWLSVRASDAVRLPCGQDASTQVSCCAPWRSVRACKPAEGGDGDRPPPPLVVAGFDIECNSAHGDFPVARKDYRRLAIDLEQVWDRGGAKGMCEYDAKECLVDSMLDAFGLSPPPASTPPSTKKTRMKGMPPMARLELKAPPRSAARVNSLVIEIKRVVDDVYAALKTTPAAAAEAAAKAKAKAAEEDQDSAEGECETSTVGRVTAALNGAFSERWPLRGDSVIQIGVTVGVHPCPPGGNICCSKHILVLGTCDPIDGVDLRTFTDEAAMLLAFVDLVKELDPDVLLGYNIFGFDMSYMHERALELLGEAACLRRFCAFGRVAGVPSSFVEQKLSSSALGDNVLRYLDMHGRVVVDLMKVVQRDHRLDSYKLDAVAEHFIGLRKNDVSPNDVFRLGGCPPPQNPPSRTPLGRARVDWDHPIFFLCRLQRGTSADRKVIAEYCIQVRHPMIMPWACHRTEQVCGRRARERG